MSQKRLSMRKIRELMRLKYELGRSHREIAASLGVANSTVSDYAGRASAAGLSWPLPEGLDDTALEAALFPSLPPSRVPRPEPDWDRVHRELQRHKGVTLRLLWLEYRTVHPDGYRYSSRPRRSMWGSAGSRPHSPSSALKSAAASDRRPDAASLQNASLSTRRRIGAERRPRDNHPHEFLVTQRRALHVYEPVEVLP